jgi:RNA polymerase sigma factor (sigma-70 family)
VNARTDQQLLRDYTGNHSEAAFTELVRRHVDLVYSAALRMVRDSHQAEDVTQSVFVALAQNSQHLTEHPVFSGWLHRTTQNLAANAVRTNVRRQTREQEAVVMNELIAGESDATWEHIAPHLDAALGELSEADRDAVLLRYFEKKSAQEMADCLGISDEAAQKRVNRAVDRLRGFFAKRGVAVGASGLAVVIAANAVQAAPVGLALTASTAAALIGTTLSTTAVAATTKAIAMTTLQKVLVTASLSILAGVGIYEARQTSRLQHQLRTVRQQNAPIVAQLEQLQRERDAATNHISALNEQIAQMKSEQRQAELLKLRGQVGALRDQLNTAQSDAATSGFAKMMSDPAMNDYIRIAMVDLVKRRYTALFQELKLSPEQIDKFTQAMTDYFHKGAQQLAASQQSGGSQPPSDQNFGEEMAKQLQALLGEDGAARFKEYSQEIPARTTVDLLNVELGASKLSDEQTARLFQIVKSEPFDATHGISGDVDEAFFGSQAELDDHLLKIMESNQRVLQQASSFLNPDQIAALNTVLTNGLNARITQGAAFARKH